MAFDWKHLLQFLYSPKPSAPWISRRHADSLSQLFWPMAFVSETKTAAEVSHQFCVPVMSPVI
jgi:hypothetical protein